jgi:hypothetical protein
MQPYVQFLVSLGQWAQGHQELVLLGSLAVVGMLGIARLATRTAIQHRRR